jgi:Rad3-related DNA helicase
MLLESGTRRRHAILTYLAPLASIYNSYVAIRAFLWLDSKRQARGQARIESDGATTDASFDSVDELRELVGGGTPELIAIGGVHPESTAATLILADWHARDAQVWPIADVCYVLGVEPPASFAGLAASAAQAWAKLEEVPSDTLAQAAELAREAGAGARLAWLTAALHQRHDALHQPNPGAVELEAYLPRRVEQETPPRQEIAEDILERVFEAQERIADAFERYEERPQQVQMAQAIAAGLEESRPVVVEAGTGVGKSLAYLIPLAVHSARTGKLCLISTNTINLQQQLVDSDIPRLRQILDLLELKITLMKGRDHYLCVKRLEDTWLKNPQSARQRRERLLKLDTPALLFILRLVLGYPMAQPDDLDALPSPDGLSQSGRGQLTRSLDCAYATCLNDRCPYNASCHFFVRRAAALQSHLVITNHALVFALLQSSDSDSNNIVTKSSVIVFDEAHNLESAITDQYTLEFSNLAAVDLGNRLLELVQHEAISKRLSLSASGAGEEWRDAFERAQDGQRGILRWISAGVEVREQVSRLLDQAAQRGHVDYSFATQLTPPTASEGQAQVLGLLGKLAQRMLVVVAKYRGLAQDLAYLFSQPEGDYYIDDDMLQVDLKALTTDLLAYHMALANWQPSDAGKLTWFNTDLSSTEQSWEYKTAPLEVGAIFQDLLSRKDCLVLCSATLTVAGSFDYLQSSLGFTPEVAGFAAWLKLDSPFDYQRQALLLVGTDMATPTGGSRDAYLTQLETVVLEAADIFPQGVLVLFNSWRDLEHIAERVSLPLEERLLIQGQSGPRAQIAERFRREGDRVLLATRSFWEGFDVMGEALQCVVVAKLPFANFKDPIHAGRQRAIDAGGGDSFNNYSLPLAVMQLKQGFGRLIRSATDYGCVFLLDSRAMRARYGKVFIDSLPGPRLKAGRYQDCLAWAREFMEEKHD